MRNFCTPLTSIQMRLKNTLLLLVTQACQMCALLDVNISSIMITAGTLEEDCLMMVQRVVLCITF